MGKFVLITGGTKGIGKAVAACLGKVGYNLLLTYGSDEAIAKEVKDNFTQLYGVEVHPIQADLSKKKSIDSIHQYITDHSIRLTALVFNAGMTNRDPFENISLTDWEKIFFANVHFPVFLLQKVIGNIEEGGSLVFTGSSMGIHPHAMSLSYGVTKSAVHSLVKNLVKFLVPYKLRVNAVAPGFVDTEWQKNKPAEIRQSIESKIALGHFCDPEELAEVYKMLIENSYFNGEVVVVDGGYSYK